MCQVCNTRLEWRASCLPAVTRPVCAPGQIDSKKSWVVTLRKPQCGKQGCMPLQSKHLKHTTSSQVVPCTIPLRISRELRLGRCPVALLETVSWMIHRSDGIGEQGLKNTFDQSPKTTLSIRGKFRVRGGNVLLHVRNLDHRGWISELESRIVGKYICPAGKEVFGGLAVDRT